MTTPVPDSGTARPGADRAGFGTSRPASLPGKLLWLGVPGLVCACAAALGLHRLGLSFGVSLGAACALGTVVSTLVIGAAWRRPRRILEALSNGIGGLRSHDYSLRLVADRDDELGDMVEIFNQLSELLGRERSDLRRREILLQTVIEASPAAVVLVNAADRIILANHTARLLFHHGRRLVGVAWSDVLGGCPEELRQALEHGHNSLVTVEIEQSDEVFHVTRRVFDLNTRRHLLISVRRMSAELRRQEVAIWKKIIRVIAHELNNSLAPVRSMVHSAKLIRQHDAGDDRLDEILEHIDQSAAGMHRFVDGYRQFARMPEPRAERIGLATLVAPLREAEPFRLECPRDVEAVELEVDAGQVRQALLNLLKNSRQAGSAADEIVLRAEPRPDGFVLVRVLDRGRGMDDETFSKALLPFYSSKKEGTGLGLALAREIVEAHGGRLSLALRPGGGLEVTCTLPAAAGDAARADHG